jgi:hypothetical protein
MHPVIPYSYAQMPLKVHALSNIMCSVNPHGWVLGGIILTAAQSVKEPT